MDLPGNTAFAEHVQNTTVWFKTFDSQMGEMLYYNVVLISASQGMHASGTKVYVRAIIRTYQAKQGD